MSKNTAAGMWAMRYSAKPSRFNVGKCHEPSTTTSSRLPTRSASQSVVTNSGLAVRLSSAMGERSAKTGPGATRSGGAEPVGQRPHQPAFSASFLRRSAAGACMAVPHEQTHPTSLEDVRHLDLALEPGRHRQTFLA